MGETRELRSIERLGYVRHIDQMVRDAGALRERRFGGAQVHATIDLH